MNFNKIINFNDGSWRIFCVFSSTEFYKSKSYNLTASIFFTNKFSNLPNTPQYLVDSNFYNIFYVDSSFIEPEVKYLDARGEKLTILSCNLDYLLRSGELFKDTLDRDLISKSVFIFNDLKWKDICKAFSERQIIISGGSSTRRHIISPIHIKMVSIIKSFGYNYEDIVLSFSNINNNKDMCMPKDDISLNLSKKEKEKELLNTSSDKLLVNNDDKKIIRKIKNGGSGLISTINNKSSDLNINNSLINKDLTKKFSTLSFNLNKLDTDHKVSQLDGKINKEYSFYLDSLKDIIEEVNNDPKKAQLNLEESWIKILKEKLLNDNTENLRSKLPSIFKKSKETLQIASENGDLKRRFKSLAEFLNNPDYLLLTLGYIISQYNYNKRNSIAMNIGNNILYEIYRNCNKDKKNKMFDNFLAFKIAKGYFNESTQKDDQTKIGRLGGYFMYLFMTDPTHIFDEKYESSEFYMDLDVNLIINPEYNDLIKNEIMLHPKSIPMVCKPNKWSNKMYGGFLENKYLKEDIITGSVYHNHNITNKENLYNCINYLNGIKFSINTELLDYLNSDKGLALVNLIDQNKLNETSEEITQSEKLQRNITLKLAEIYKNIAFYLNVHSDWRGRIYTHSFFISYQGGDLNSAVLQFYDGQIISESGLNYLYIYGANCYGKDGLDKKPFDIRIKWVKENLKSILSMDPKFIASAESPYLFLAFSLVLKNLEENPKSIIRLPVFLDATCSGIQHLAALLSDFNLGSNVNLVPNENIADIYSSLLKPINKNINKFGDENIEFNNLSEIKLSRKNIKVPIMTKVYNVSVMGIKDQLTTNFKKVKISEKTFRYEAPGKNGKILLNDKEIFKIANIINDTIFEQYPSLKIIYNYFLEIVKMMLILGIPIIWFTPSGLEITQSYLKSKVHKVSISFRGRKKIMVLRDWLDKVDTRKQVNAIIPNIIHSLDASHLINLINSAIKNKFTPIISVHDCFGTHPNLMDQLSHEVKKEFILLYTNSNFLESFHNKIIQSIKDNNFEIIEKDNSLRVIHNKKPIKIPECPKIGKLELKNIIDSKYMIC